MNALFFFSLMCIFFIPVICTTESEEEGKEDPCYSYLCFNGGTCFLDGENPMCICPDLDAGPHCEGMEQSSSIIYSTSAATTYFPELPTIESSTTYACHCGENSKSCRYLFNGDKICDCFPGYVPNHGNCDECNCGPYGSCYFEYGRKKCICRNNAFEMQGVCVELRTTSERTRHPTTDIPTIIYSTKEVPECNCGPYGSCNFENGRKKCYCKWYAFEADGVCVENVRTTTEGFTDTTDSSTVTSSNTKVPECNCGPYGSCTFEYGRKKCHCRWYAFEMNGVCVEKFRTTEKSLTDTTVSSFITRPITHVPECNCGPYGSCSFENGRKKCHCRWYAFEMNGVCVETVRTTPYSFTDSFTSTGKECNCGPYGSCSFENGRKKCYCRWPAFELNGVCVEYVRTTTKIPLDPVVTSIPGCDCGPLGRCTFEYGLKKCLCDPFTSERNGKCVDCNCGKNSDSCYFNSKDDKVCSCSVGYAQKYGMCHECNCGLNAHSCFFRENGNKICGCHIGFIQKDGFCSDICSEDKCLHGKCEVIENDFKCRCNEGYIGRRCEEKIQTKSNKEDLWMILHISVAIAFLLLLSGIFCFWTRILNKISKN